MTRIIKSIGMESSFILSLYYPWSCFLFLRLTVFSSCNSNCLPIWKNVSEALEASSCIKYSPYVVKGVPELLWDTFNAQPCTLKCFELSIAWHSEMIGITLCCLRWTMEKVDRVFEILLKIRWLSRRLEVEIGNNRATHT